MRYSIRNLVLVSLVLTAFSSAYAVDEKVKSDKEVVNNACAQDAQTAGCSGETVGHGLLRCIRKYRKEHKDFKISSGCELAVNQLRSDKKAAKSEKK